MIRRRPLHIKSAFSTRCTGGFTVRIAVLFLLSTAAIAFSLPREARAQQEYLSVAPARYSVGFRHAPDENFSFFLLGYERSIPVANLLPQVSPDSFVEFIRLQAGVRVDKGGPARFRSRATAAAFGIQKKPWAAQLSLLDVDASGLLDFSADWLAFGLGPGFDIGSRPLKFVAKALALGSINSTRFGESVFSDIGEAAGHTRHTARYGGVGTAGFVAPGKASLLGRYELNRYAVDAGIEQTSLGLALGLNLSPKMELSGAYRLVKLTIDDLKDRSTVFEFGLRYTPAETY